MKITAKKKSKVWVLTTNDHHEGPVYIVGVYATEDSAQEEYDRRYEDMCARWLSLNIKEMELLP